MKKYTAPEIDITLFHTADIITASDIDAPTLSTYSREGTAEELKFSQIWPDADA